MTWKFTAVLSIALPFAGIACTDLQIVSMPPKWPSRQVRHWWEHTLDTMPLDQLAVYAAASEIFRQNNSTACYVHWDVGPFVMSFIPFVPNKIPDRVTYYPLPIPVEFAEKVKCRLLTYQPIESQFTFGLVQNYWSRNYMQSEKNCTDEEATAMWKMAEFQVAQRHTRPPPETLRP